MIRSEIQRELESKTEGQWETERGRGRGGALERKAGETGRNGEIEELMAKQGSFVEDELDFVKIH